MDFECPGKTYHHVSGEVTWEIQVCNAASQLPLLYFILITGGAIPRLARAFQGEVCMFCA